jgi:hypothetical protein
VVIEARNGSLGRGGGAGAKHPDAYLLFPSSFFLFLISFINEKPSLATGKRGFVARKAAG